MTTPEVTWSGCRQFATDVRSLFGDDDDNWDGGESSRQSLLQLSKFMAMERKNLGEIKRVFARLIHEEEEELSLHAFQADGTIANQATSMLAAKGFSSLSLQDAISVLNRRLDI
eukprot:CAMPEP_0116863950 /NCGR_PEP_ID=MMETSP0418-20121206/24537_1 /TAXON_ID=1158023 /ORGANISM="Astrosyne radiata, Strain 13vi08-1A" /LENGTH=113 /DNA_ID=CAMNT_0004499089 /DNA_START=284 /DNA_END=625 /DNA_ORIENTATION=+